MAMIVNDKGRFSTTVPQTGSVSTPEPVDVPRWESDVPDLPALIQGSFTQEKVSPPPLSQLGLSLGSKPTLSLDTIMPSLRSARVDEWRDAFAPVPKYQAGNAAQLTQAIKNLGSSLPGGVNAYGYKGVTGLAGLKGKSPFGFQTPMWNALSAANAAMKAAGLGTFGITDGFRSYDQQVALKKKKPDLAATPGKSIHGLGLAADLKLTAKQAEWLRKNGEKFGIYAPIFEKESWHWQLLPTLWGGFK